MSARRGLVACGFVLLVLAMAAATAVLAKANEVPQWSGSVAFTFGVGSFAVVGALILWRQPRNTVGRIFVAIGFLWTSGDFFGQYAVYGYVTEPGAVPLPALGAWYGEWFWFAFLMLTFSVLPQVFPTGRPLPGRWRLFYRVVLAFVGVTVALAMLEVELELPASEATIHNPFGIPGHTDIEEGWMAPFVLVGSIAAIGGGLTSMILRFRRSRGEERQQLKWFTLAASFLVAQFVIQSAFGGDDGHPIPTLDGIALAAVPTAAFIAIQRHRLYDIDLVINRTLVYGVLTALLGTAYVGCIALFRAIIPVGGSDLGVAVSTLVVAALVAPVRKRVQATIDQLFYRQKYDAARAVSGFSTRLRDEVDLGTVRSDLLSVVEETVQPARISVWLREPSAAEGGGNA